MTDTFTIWREPAVIIAGDADNIKRVTNGGAGIAFYGGDQAVSSQDEKLEVGDSVDLACGAWFVSDSSSHFTIVPIKTEDADNLVDEVEQTVVRAEQVEKEEEVTEAKEKSDEELAAVAKREHEEMESGEKIEEPKAETSSSSSTSSSKK